MAAVVQLVWMVVLVPVAPVMELSLLVLVVLVVESVALASLQLSVALRPQQHRWFEECVVEMVLESRVQRWLHLA